MRGTAELRRRILNRTARVAVIGQGYVGLSLACAAAEAGFHVSGVDTDAERVKGLGGDSPVVAGVKEDLVRSAIATGRLTFDTSASVVAESELVFICVPTPLRDGTPDLTHIDAACADVARYLGAGTLVVLESTTYPGTTEQRVRPALESPGMAAGRNFLLAYSPERIDPGSTDFPFGNVPRVVGGLDAESTAVAVLFYEQLVNKVMAVSSCRAAELAKLLENTFRHVNIALANEMAMLCHEVDIDVWEVIEAAATKPFGFMPFYPGPGVGGHCIPLDPTYLAWQMKRDAGHQFRVLAEAEDINAQMPAWVAGRIAEVLNEKGRAVKGARILVLGVAYKPDVGDVRESPAVKIMQLLRKRGAHVEFHDPYVQEVTVHGNSIHRTDLTNHTLACADLVAVLTPHRAYDLGRVAEHSQLVFDAMNAFPSDKSPNVVRL